jgi:hypothetical protein
MCNEWKLHETGAAFTRQYSADRKMYSLKSWQPPFEWNCKPKTTIKLSFCDNRKTFARCRKKFMSNIFSFGLQVFILHQIELLWIFSPKTSENSARNAAYRKNIWHSL